MIDTPEFTMNVARLDELLQEISNFENNYFYLSISSISVFWYPLLHQKSARAHLNMRNGFDEIVDGAGIRKSSFDVVLLPIDVIDLTRHVFTHDVIFLYLVQGQMGIVYANKNDSWVVSLVDDDAIVEFWDWNLSWIVVDIQMIFSPDSTDVLQLSYSPSSSVNIQVDVTIGRENSEDKFQVTKNFCSNWIPISPCSILNCRPVQCIEFLPLE